jgi:hypothetical protein
MSTIGKDIRARFGPARDQGRRPTCLAFALSDAHAADRSPHVGLSPDFLYYHALQRMPAGHGDNGVGLTEALEALDQDGQPIELVWPYLSRLPDDLKAWQPPTGVKVLFASGRATAATVNAICVALDADQAAVVVFQPTESFYSVRRDGTLPRLALDPDFPQLHAVVAVGYATEDGERQVLVRNSWGATWGDSGCAWMPEDYLAPRLVSITTIAAR